MKVRKIALLLGVVLASSSVFADALGPLSYKSVPPSKAVSDAGDKLVEVGDKREFAKAWDDADDDEYVGDKREFAKAERDADEAQEIQRKI